MKPALLPTEVVILGDRERTDYGNIDELCDSINEHGIIQPIVVDESMNVVDGGRRYSAAIKLGLTEVPVVLKETSGSELTLRKLEFVANEDRKDYNWKERCRSIANIHHLSSVEKWKDGGIWIHKQTARLLNISTGGVAEALKIANLLRDEKHPIQQAESMIDALSILLQIEEDRVKAYNTAMTLAANASTMLPHTEFPPMVDNATAAVEDLAWLEQKQKSADQQAAAKAANICGACEGSGKNTKGEVCFICKGLGTWCNAEEEGSLIPLSSMFIHGDSLQVLDKMSNESVHHCVSDPPYAIDTDMMEQAGKGLKDIDRTKEEHKVEENLDLLVKIIPRIFRVLKPGGFCVLYADEENREYVTTVLLHAGFKVQRWSLIWCKTGGLNQCAQYNFTKATEIVIVARKELGMLVSPQALNYRIVGPADKNKFSHPFAKPIELHEWILRAIALPGQIILDPFMGSGTLPYAAARLGMSPRGIELVKFHYDETIMNMQECYTTLMAPRKVRFR